MGFDPQKFASERPLSKAEHIAIDHYKKNPTGRGFFSVAEIMAKHQEIEEAIQLLGFGLERHPSYSVARVYLAQLLLKRGHISLAWDTLEQSPLPLRGNLTAQLLRLKLAVLMGRQDEVLDLKKDLSLQEFVDSEAQIIVKQLEIKPFDHVRRDFADYLKIPLSDLPRNVTHPLAPSVGEARVPETTAPLKTPGELEVQASFRERVAKGFFATPIQSLFQKPEIKQASDPADLDSLTHARLLRRQGLFAKAAEIYQRLVHETPTQDLLRREYQEICELRDAQKKIDQSINPEVVKTMEKVRNIDERLRLLNELLTGLDRIQHEFI